jgi:hypothetical protein
MKQFVSMGDAIFGLQKKLRNWQIKATIMYILQLFHNKRKSLYIYLKILMKSRKLFQNI